MLVLIYDDFRADNEGTVREVMRFIGVDADREVDALEVNPSILMRSQRLDDLVHTVTVGRGGPVSRAARATMKAVLPRTARREALSVTRRRIVHARPPESDEAFMRELRARFKGEVVALGEHMQRDLVQLWGYEDVD
jgi:hypothetical protein